MATSRRAASKPADDTGKAAEPDKTTDPSKGTGTKASETKPAAKAEETYTSRAATLAAQIRDSAETIRREVETINALVLEQQQAMMPRPGEARVAGGVRRIPMASADVARAVEGLIAAAVDLQRRAGE